MAKERTDSERLEWLAQSGAYMAFSRDGDGCWLCWPYGRDPEEGEFEKQSGAFDTIRDSIDAEMKEESR